MQFDRFLKGTLGENGEVLRESMDPSRCHLLNVYKAECKSKVAPLVIFSVTRVAVKREAIDICKSWTLLRLLWCAIRARHRLSRRRTDTRMH